MTANSCCTHETLGYTLKFKQVQKRIKESHSLVWVKYGEVFRNATLAEAYAMRMAEPKQPDPTPLGFGRSGETPGCVYKPPVAAMARTFASKRIARASGFLFGAKYHLQESCATNDPIAIVEHLLAETCNSQQANQFCQAHA